MGRALHVSRSLPPIISSARIVTSIEKPNCISSFAEDALSDCKNGELPLYNRLYPNTGFLRLPARQSALGPKTMFRVCQNPMLARCFSSGTELSDSEWPDTDDDCGKGSGHCTVPRQDRVAVNRLPAAYETETETETETCAPSTLIEPNQPDEEVNLLDGSQKMASQRRPAKWGQVRQVAHAIEAETDADTVARSSSENEHLHHGRGKFGLCHDAESETDADLPPLVAKQKQVRQAAYVTETETDDDIVANTSNEDEHLHHGKLKNGLRNGMRSKSASGSGRLCADWQTAYVTETETDADPVAPTFTVDKHVHHGRQKFGSRHETKSETQDETVTSTSCMMKADRGRWTSRSHHPPAECAQVQRVRQATYETASETDAGTESDDNYHHDEKLNLYDPKQEIVSEAGSSTSDWHETDEDNYVQEQRQEDDESETEFGSDASDWAETDEDEETRLWKDVYGSGGESDGDNAGSSSLSRSRDTSHLKVSAFDRSTSAHRAPERPSKKERSAGLSPRTIRDDDSDEVEIESDLEGELQEEIERQMAAEPKFERPSITWGILLTRDLRQAARENVLKYLETEGINTSELTRIELPTKVDVMQTRLGFLRKLGLDTDAINKYPLVLGCSVSKNMVPVLKYLKKLDFPQSWLPVLLKKYPMILHTSVVIDILPVIYFLRGLDIDPLDIPRVLLKYPDVLGFKTEGTMSTSVAYLVSMGVNLRHVGYMLTEYPEILGMRVASLIRPKFEYLMSLGIPQTIVAKILVRRPYLFGYHLENRMQANVNHLLEMGVRKEAIPGMVAQFPEILGRVFMHSIMDHVNWFKEHLELDADGVASIIEKMPQVVLMPTTIARERIRFLKSEHFTDAEIGSMVTQCPQILVSSVSDSLRPNLTFLTRQMKRSQTELLNFPAFFTYSLRARIRPRFEALTDRDAQCSLDWLLNCSDSEFQKRLKAGSVGCERPGVEFVMGGLLPRKPLLDESEFQPSEHREVAAL